MAKPYKAPNKRIILRAGNGRFRKTRPEDFGIGGVCEVCRHLLLRHYDGDPRDRLVDPRKFRYRCFTCEPETEAEKALRLEIEAAKPKRVGLIEMLEKAVAQEAL